jgi:hypothetical protein
MSLLKKVKKANGQIIACNEIFERKPTKVKNFGIWIRAQVQHPSPSASHSNLQSIATDSSGAVKLAKPQSHTPSMTFVLGSSRGEASLQTHPSPPRHISFGCA